MNLALEIITQNNPEIIENDTTDRKKRIKLWLKSTALAEIYIYVVRVRPSAHQKYGRTNIVLNTLK